jgi:hypothetical protein
MIPVYEGRTYGSLTGYLQMAYRGQALAEEVAQPGLVAAREFPPGKFPGYIGFRRNPVYRVSGSRIAVPCSGNGKSGWEPGRIDAYRHKHYPRAGRSPPPPSFQDSRFSKLVRFISIETG